MQFETREETLLRGLVVKNTHLSGTIRWKAIQNVYIAITGKYRSLSSLRNKYMRMTLSACQSHHGCAFDKEEPFVFDVACIEREAVSYSDLEWEKVERMLIEYVRDDTGYSSVRDMEIEP